MKQESAYESPLCVVLRVELRSGVLAGSNEQYQNNQFDPEFE